MSLLSVIDNPNRISQIFLEDDTKLSKLVRRIVNVEDRDRRLNAARNLQEYVDYVDFDILLRSTPHVIEALTNVIDARGTKMFQELRMEVLACLGNLGAIMMRKNSADLFFEHLFESLYAASDDETRVYHLDVVTLVLQYHSSRGPKFQSQSGSKFAAVSALTRRVQTCLESAESSTLLVGVVSVLDAIVALYPNVIRDSFQDIVDILVGWHIDSQQKQTIVKNTSRTLISMRQFWVRDMEYSLTLMSHFLEDMEEYRKDLADGDSREEGEEEEEQEEEREKVDVKESTNKIGALINVFMTVLQVREHFDPGENLFSEHKTHDQKIFPRFD